MKTEEIKGYTLTYDDSPEAKERVFALALAAFKKLGRYCGESITQCDQTYEQAPEILTELAEEGFKFEREWKD